MANILADIEREILAGLTNERPRLDRAWNQLNVYNANFPDDLSFYYDSDKRSTRNLPLMQRVVDQLTGHLYKGTPQRTIPNHEDATAFLTQILDQNRGTALWQTADRYAHASDEFAFQVAGTDDPLRPLKLIGWPANTFVVWTSEDDPLIPVAVATIDRFDNQRRLRLWTDDEVRTYRTKKWNGETWGGTAFYLTNVEVNAYGTIPFSFVHYRAPTIDFYSGGIGTVLSVMNDHINFRLRSIADAIRYLSRPVVVYQGVDPAFEMPANLRPGEGVLLGGSRKDSRGEVLDPDLKYVTPPLDWVSKEWDDLNAYFDLTLQSVGVPPAAMRLVQTSARSGASIVAEQLPLLVYAKCRGEVMKYFEEDLAKKIIEVGAAHLRNNNLPTGHLDEALADFQVIVKYAVKDPEYIGPEKRDEEKFLLDNRLVSPIQIIMDRFGLSREEAEQHITQVAEDDKFIESLMPAPEPVTPPVTPPTNEPMNQPQGEPDVNPPE